MNTDAHQLLLHHQTNGSEYSIQPRHFDIVDAPDDSENPMPKTVRDHRASLVRTSHTKISHRSTINFFLNSVHDQFSYPLVDLRNPGLSVSSGYARVPMYAVESRTKPWSASFKYVAGSNDAIHHLAYTLRTPIVHNPSGRWNGIKSTFCHTEIQRTC